MMKEKIGEMLGVIYEHKTLFICSLITMIGMIIGIQMISFHFYGMQLVVIKASINQPIIWLCDFCTICIVYSIYRFLSLKKVYDKK